MSFTSKQIYEGRKNLIFVINRNIYILNILKELNLRLVTTKLTLHYTKALLISDMEDADDKKVYESSITKVNNLINDIDLQLTYYTPHQGNYGSLDVENCRIMGDLIEICLTHNILRMDFKRMDMNELMGSNLKEGK